MFKNINFGYGTATAASTANALTITMSTADRANFPTTFPFYVTSWDTAKSSPVGTTNREILTVTTSSGSGIFTVTRASQGTTARSIAIGDPISLTVTKSNMDEIETAITNVEPLYNGTLQKTTAGATTTIDGWTLTAPATASAVIFGAHDVNLGATGVFLSPLIPVGGIDSPHTVSFNALPVANGSGAKLKVEVLYYAADGTTPVSPTSDILLNDIAIETTYGATTTAPKYFVLRTPADTAGLMRYARIRFTASVNASYVFNIGWDRPLPSDYVTSAVTIKANVTGTAATSTSTVYEQCGDPAYEMGISTHSQYTPSKWTLETFLKSNHATTGTGIGPDQISVGHSLVSDAATKSTGLVDWVTPSNTITLGMGTGSQSGRVYVKVNGTQIGYLAVV